MRQPAGWHHCVCQPHQGSPLSCGLLFLGPAAAATSPRPRQQRPGQVWHATAPAAPTAMTWQQLLLGCLASAHGRLLSRSRRSSGQKQQQRVQEQQAQAMQPLQGWLGGMPEACPASCAATTALSQPHSTYKAVLHQPAAADCCRGCWCHATSIPPLADQLAAAHAQAVQCAAAGSSHWERAWTELLAS